MRARWAFLPILLFSVQVAAQPREFRDCPDCPVMIALPPGALELQGPPRPVPPVAPGAGRQRGAATPPPNRLTVPAGVALGKFPVTRDEFQAFMQASGHVIEDRSCLHLPDPDRPPGTMGFTGVRGYWLEPPFEQAGTHPVVCVNHKDAVAYVTWLSQRTGRRYRLPSQVEWEYAARAGSRTARYWTEGPEQACAYANGADRTAAVFFGMPTTARFLVPCEDGFAHTAPVGSFRPNAFGFHDMLGNVRQMMQD